MPRAVRVGPPGQKKRLIAYKVIRRQVTTSARVGVVTAKSRKAALEQVQGDSFFGVESTPVVLETEWLAVPIYSGAEFMALREIGSQVAPAWYGSQLPGLPYGWWNGLKVPSKE